MSDQYELERPEVLPLRDLVFHTLRKAILTGELKPGERLMEIHLADKLGVSRTPIREAIRKLELEGLVTMVPRKGAMVAEISEAGLKDVLEVRRDLDAFCAELASIRITNEAKEELKKACEAFEDAVKSGDVSVIAKADVNFHDIIIRATANDRLITLINNLAEQIYRYRYEYIKDTSRHEMLMKEHRVLLDAILKGDSKAAREASTVHIDNQEKAILKLLNLS